MPVPTYPPVGAGILIVLSDVWISGSSNAYLSNDRFSDGKGYYLIGSLSYRSRLAGRRILESQAPPRAFKGLPSSPMLLLSKSREQHGPTAPGHDLGGDGLAGQRRMHMTLSGIGAARYQTHRLMI